jgi:hypothetical protein
MRRSFDLEKRIAFADDPVDAIFATTESDDRTCRAAPIAQEVETALVGKRNPVVCRPVVSEGMGGNL